MKNKPLIALAICLLLVTENTLPQETQTLPYTKTNSNTNLSAPLLSEGIQTQQRANTTNITTSEQSTQLDYAFGWFLKTMHLNERSYAGYLSFISTTKEPIDPLSALENLHRAYMSMTHGIYSIKRTIPKDSIMHPILEKYQQDLAQLHADMLLVIEMKYTLGIRPDKSRAIKKLRLKKTKEIQTRHPDTYASVNIALHRIRQNYKNIELRVQQLEQKISGLQNEIDNTTDYAVRNERQHTLKNAQDEWFTACEELEEISITFQKKIGSQIDEHIMTLGKENIPDVFLGWKIENAIYSLLLVRDTGDFDTILRELISKQFGSGDSTTELINNATDVILKKIKTSRDILKTIRRKELLGTSNIFLSLLTNVDAKQIINQKLSPTIKILRKKEDLRNCILTLLVIVLEVLISIWCQTDGWQAQIQKYYQTNQTTQKSVSTNFSEHTTQPDGSTSNPANKIVPQTTGTVNLQNFPNQIPSTEQVQAQQKLLFETQLTKLKNEIEVETQNIINIELAAKDKENSLERENAEFFNNFKEKNNCTPLPDQKQQLSEEEMAKINWKSHSINNTNRQHTGNTNEEKTFKNISVPKNKKVSHGGISTNTQFVAFCPSSEYLATGTFQTINPITGSYIPKTPSVKEWNIPGTNNKGEYVAIAGFTNETRKVPIPPNYIITNVKTENELPEDALLCLWHDYENYIWYLEITSTIDPGYIRVEITKATENNKIKITSVNIDPNTENNWEKHIPESIRKICEYGKTKSTQERQEIKNRILGFFYYTTNPLLETENTENFLKTAFTYYALKCDGLSMLDMVLSHLLDIPQVAQVGFVSKSKTFHENSAHAWILNTDGIRETTSLVGQCSPLHLTNATKDNYTRELEYLEMRAHLQEKLLDNISESMGTICSAQNKIKTLRAQISYIEKQYEKQTQQPLYPFYIYLQDRYRREFEKISIPTDQDRCKKLLLECENILENLEPTINNEYQLMALGHAILCFIEKIEARYPVREDIFRTKQAVYASIEKLAKLHSWQLLEIFPQDIKDLPYNYSTFTVTLPDELLPQEQAPDQENENFHYSDIFSKKILELEGELVQHAGHLAVIKNTETGLYQIIQFVGEKTIAYNNGQTFKTAPDLCPFFSLQNEWIATTSIRGQDFLGPLAEKNDLLNFPRHVNYPPQIYAVTPDGDVLTSNDRNWTTLKFFAGNIAGRYKDKELNIWSYPRYTRDIIYVFQDKTWIGITRTDIPIDRRSIIGTAITEEEEQNILAQESRDIKLQALHDGRWIAAIHSSSRNTYQLKARGVTGIPKDDQPGTIYLLNLLTDGTWMAVSYDSGKRYCIGTFWDKLSEEQREYFIQTIELIDVPNGTSKIEVYMSDNGRWKAYIKEISLGSPVKIGSPAGTLTENTIRDQVPTNKYSYLSRIEALYNIAYPNAQLPLYRFDLRFERIANLVENSQKDLAAKELCRVLEDMSKSEPENAIYFHPVRTMEIILKYKDIAYKLSPESLGFLCNLLMATPSEYLIVELLGNTTDEIRSQVISKNPHILEIKNRLLKNWSTHVETRYGTPSETVTKHVSLFSQEKTRGIITELYKLKQELSGNLSLGNITEELSSAEKAFAALSLSNSQELTPEAIEYFLKSFKESIGTDRKFDIEYAPFSSIHPVNILQKLPAWTKYMDQEQRDKFMLWQKINTRLNEIFEHHQDCRGREQFDSNWYDDYRKDAVALIWSIGISYIIFGGILLSYYLKKHDHKTIVFGSIKKEITSLFRKNPLLQNHIGKEIKKLCEIMFENNFIFTPEILYKWNVLYEHATPQIRLIMKIIISMGLEPVTITDMQTKDYIFGVLKLCLWVTPGASIIPALWDAKPYRRRGQMNSALIKLALNIDKTTPIESTYKQYLLLLNRYSIASTKSSTIPQQLDFDQISQQVLDKIKKIVTITVPRLPTTKTDPDGISCDETLKTTSGYDFAGHREYRPLDEPKHIDQKASARADKPLVKTFDPTMEQELALLIDMRTPFDNKRIEELAYSLATACYSRHHADVCNYRLKKLIFIFPGNKIEQQNIHTKDIEALLYYIGIAYKKCGTIDATVIDREFYGKEKNKRYSDRQSASEKSARKMLAVNLLAAISAKPKPTLIIGTSPEEREAISTSILGYALEWQNVNQVLVARWVPTIRERVLRLKGYLVESHPLALAIAILLSPAEYALSIIVMTAIVHSFVRLYKYLMASRSQQHLSRVKISDTTCTLPQITQILPQSITRHASKICNAA